MNGISRIYLVPEKDKKELYWFLVDYGVALNVDKIKRWNPVHSIITLLAWEINICKKRISIIGKCENWHQIMGFFLLLFLHPYVNLYIRPSKFTLMKFTGCFSTLH